MNILNFSEDWIQDVEVDEGSVPAGTFTKKADEIVKTLLEVTGNDVTKAVRKITFYINRFGKSLPNRSQVLKAKDTLVNME